MRTTAFDRTYEVHALVICVYMCVLIFDLFVALRDLVPFVKFENMKNTHGGVLVLVKLQVAGWSQVSHEMEYKQHYTIANSIHYYKQLSFRDILIQY